jgi:hypothetical protein
LIETLDVLEELQPAAPAGPPVIKMSWAERPKRE